MYTYEVKSCVAKCAFVYISMWIVPSIYTTIRRWKRMLRL